MIVDNPLIELARMAPLGILVGISLGLPTPAARSDGRAGAAGADPGAGRALIRLRPA